MHSFKDSEGRTWELSINVATIKRVKGLTGTNIAGLIEKSLDGLESMLADVIGFVDVLYALCKDQAEAKGITDEDFGASLHGDPISDAADAFVDELVDFLPEKKRREALRKVVAAGRRVRDKMVERAILEVEGMDLDSEMEKLIGQSGAARASSESTPAPSVSANSS